MDLRNLDWTYFSALLALFMAVFGAGVSLGRYVPAQQGEESLELRDRLVNICTGENVSGYTPVLWHFNDTSI